MPLKIFVDTEFSDFVDSQLISIGLVAESGEEFYAELPYALAVSSPRLKPIEVSITHEINNILSAPVERTRVERLMKRIG